MKYVIVVAIAIIGIAVAASFFVRPSVEKYAFRPTPAATPQALPPPATETIEPIRTIAENLAIPWDLVFLPDGDILVTERPGTVRKIGSSTTTVIRIEDVSHRGEGGLLGIVLHPDFKTNGWVYLYQTTARSDGSLLNRVTRFRFTGAAFVEPKIILDRIPGAAYHDGGELAFGPDGYLYVTTGDAGRAELAQDRTSLAGKILRLKDDGSIPADNPFGTAIYSYGHRNPQGLAWDDRGRLWATEHGRSGIASGLDEVNLIEKGKNYGWPVIQGDEKKEDMISPVIQSGPDETWAPAGLAFLNGRLFFGGLRGESLYDLTIAPDGSPGAFVAHFREAYGRIRAVVVGPDGFLYVTTSNRDGRGRTRPGDDKILRIDPRGL